jgi:hypothetical protein
VVRNKNPWVGGPDEVWPAGGPGQFWLAQPISSNNPQNSIYFFDGTTASPTAIGGWPASAGIASLWARSPTDVWGAGQDVAHNDGAGWTKVSGTPDAVLDPHHLHNDGLVTGDATTTWLVGRGPRFFRQAAPAAP